MSRAISLLVALTACAPQAVVNHAPVLVPPPDVTLAPGDTLSEALQASDPDGNAVTFDLADGPSDATLDGARLTWTAPTGGGTTVSFTVEARDDGDPPLVDDATFTVTVPAPTPPANQPPVLERPDDDQIALGSTLSETLVAHDPDGDQLAWALETGPAGAELRGPDLQWTPQAGDVGPHLFLISVTDDGTPPLQDTSGFLVTVIDPNAPHVNHPPELQPPSDVTVDVGGTLSVPLTVTDPDGDPVTLSLLEAPATGVALDNQTITWSPSGTDVGVHAFLVAATDDGVPPLSAYASFTVTVVDPNAPGVNHAPVIQPIADQTIDVGAQWQVGVLAADADGDTLYDTLLTGPTGMTLADTVLSWTPTIDDVGTYPVLVETTDNGVPPLSDYVLFSVTVVDPNAPGINHPPVLVPPTDATVTAGDTLAIPLAATDADGNGLTFGLADGPSGAQVSSGTFTWTPTVQDVGAHGVVVSVTDDGVPPLTDLAAFVVTVLDPQGAGANPPPVFTATPADLTHDACAQMQLDFTAWDPDGAGVTFWSPALPDGATLQETGRSGGTTSASLVWTPRQDQPGTYPVTVYAVDDASHVATPLVLSIDVPAVPPPTVEASAVFQAGDPVVLPVADHPCYDVQVTSPLPQGATWSDQDHAVEWQPTNDDFGIYWLTYTVTDHADPPVTTDLSGYLTVAFHDSFTSFTGYSQYDILTRGADMTYTVYGPSSDYDDLWALVVQSGGSQFYCDTISKSRAWRVLDRSEAPIGHLDWDVRAWDLTRLKYDTDMRLEFVPYAVTDPAVTWPDVDATSPLSIQVPQPLYQQHLQQFDGGADLGTMTTALTLALEHNDYQVNYCGEFIWDHVDVTPALPPPIDVHVDWKVDCGNPAPQIVEIPNMPAGTWRVTAQQSAATATGTDPAGNWGYTIPCAGLDGSDVSSSFTWPSPTDAWNNMGATTADVTWPGGDLVCGVSDIYCDDNLGSVDFTLEYLHP